MHFIDYKEDAAHMWRVGNHNPNDYFKWATGTTFNTDTVMRLTRGGDLLIEGNLDVNGAIGRFCRSNIIWWYRPSRYILSTTLRRWWNIYRKYIRNLYK